VCAPGEAIDCYLRTDMDTLVMGNYVVRKPRPAEGERSAPGSIRVSEVSR
jgi:hypothetical protein